MNNNREVSWFMVGVLLLCLAVGQCTTSRKIARISDTQVVLLCIHAAEAGVKVPSCESKGVRK